MLTEYLIVGNSAGGIGAVEGIRELDTGAEITIVSDEPYPAYSRPLIAKYLAHQRAEWQLALRPPDFYERNGVTLLLSQRAESLDAHGRTLTLAGGAVLRYEKLLLATGSQPIRPPLPGLDLRHVYSFMTLDDARSLDSAMTWARRVVVVGGGLIGVSVLEALLARGIEVVLVELRERLLPNMLDARASRLVTEALRHQRVRLVFERSLESVLPRPHDSSLCGAVRLSDGEEIGAHAVVVAIGVRPRLDLLRGTPIRVNAGIEVDERMATSVPGVYACGDAAEVTDFVRGERRVIPVWPNAYWGGIVAGRNMAGSESRYPGSVPMNSAHYFGLDILSAGEVEGETDPACQVLLREDADDVYRKIVLRQGRLVGFILAGCVENAGVLLMLMREGADVTPIKDALLEPDFALIDVPEELRERLLREGAVPSARLASA